MAVQIRDLCKAFGNKKVLNKLNITLEDGGIYCLMGPSGMGKTTLLRIIMNLETKDSGTITGIDPSADISAMFQEDRILPMLNAVDNVNMMYEKKRPAREIREDLATILPRRCLSQPVCELSGGMKRRVSLARTMHYQGKLIILDEPFTGLDVDTKREVISYILKNRRGRILLVATHGQEDAALLGAQIIHLEECQERTGAFEEMPESAAEDRGELMARAQKLLGAMGDRQLAQFVERLSMQAEAGAFEAHGIYSSLQKKDGVRQKIRIMDRIPQTDWEHVVEMLNGRVQTYEKGAILWRVGDACRDLPVVLEGAVAAYTVDAQQKDSLVSRFEAGHCFGEMLVLNGGRSPVNVKAVEKTRIMYLSNEIFAEVDYHTRAGVRAMLAWNIMHEMADKMETLAGKLQTISEPTLRSRLISYIRSLPCDDKGNRVMIQTQKEMALYLHVHPVSVSKELNAMGDEGLIRRSSNRIEILRPDVFGI